MLGRGMLAAVIMGQDWVQEVVTHQLSPTIYSGYLGRVMSLLNIYDPVSLISAMKTKIGLL